MPQTIFLGKTAKGQKPITSLLSALVAGILYEYTTEAAAPLAGDIIKLGPVETDVKPVDAALLTDDLDTNGAPTLTMTVGILNAAGTDIDAAATSAWITASTVGQTGGIARATSANVYLSGRAGTPRQLGVKIVTAPATWAGAGKNLAVLLSAAG
jgi:hypothetical protein